MLYIIATPIGNLEDVTLRALRLLKEVDFVLSEDTRKTANLLRRFQIKNKLISFYEHNEERKIPKIIGELKKGGQAALVSSAGTPAVSDPGFKLIKSCRENNIPITCLPGASSLTAALALSSIPHDKFIFLGYLPRKKGARLKLFSRVLDFSGACVFFESPYRVLRSLEELQSALGNRKITVCREMTKKFEEVLESNIQEVRKKLSFQKPRGEFTFVVEGRQVKS